MHETHFSVEDACQTHFCVSLENFFHASLFFSCVSMYPYFTVYQ